MERRLATLPLLFLLALPAPLQDIIIRRAAADPCAGATDWTADPDMQSCWSLDEDGLADRVDGCGTNDLDVDPANAIDNNTTHFIEGTASADPDASDATNQRLVKSNNDISSDWCGKVACSEVTFGCWVRIDTEATGTDNVLTRGDMRIQIQANFLRCRVRTTGTSGINLNSTTNPAVGGSYWIACSYDENGGSDNFRIVVNGVEENTATMTGPLFTSTSSLFLLSSATSNEVEGQVDLCFQIEQALTDAELLGISQCGLDGNGLP